MDKQKTLSELMKEGWKLLTSISQLNNESYEYLEIEGRGKERSTLLFRRLSDVKPC